MGRVWLVCGEVPAQRCKVGAHIQAVAVGASVSLELLVEVKQAAMARARMGWMAVLPR